MNQERLLKVIIGPHISEKTANITQAANQFVFKVLGSATKHEIKSAVEQMFNVKVKAVNTLNTNGKKKRFGQIFGHRKSFKKAYVSLHEGHTIEFLNANG